MSGLTTYTTREVADLIGINSDQVRHYVRRKLIQPARGVRGEFRFSFQDVVLLRTAKGLLDANVSSRKAYRALVKLKEEKSQVQSLSAVRIYANGPNVVVRDDNQVWEVETGQTALDFAFQEVAANNIEELADEIPYGAAQESDFNSDEWYNLGLDLEEAEPDKAPEAYKEAIRLDPKNADAHVNLGRLYQLKGNLKYAKRHYELALTARPGHQLAFYNLGTVFDELEEIEKAADYYEKAPGIPDAHYNLARIFELNGDEVSALRHIRQYRDLLDEEGA
jgi:tetratricopeptide (TPR) repeat protein